MAAFLYLFRGNRFEASLVCQVQGNVADVSVERQIDDRMSVTAGIPAVGRLSESF
jgi:hypothetical protein